MLSELQYSAARRSRDRKYKHFPGEEVVLKCPIELGVTVSNLSLRSAKDSGWKR